MKVLLGIATFCLVVGGILVLGTSLSWFDLVTHRPMAKYAKETERQVYVNSAAHQEGADAGIGIDCGNMRNVSLPDSQRHAFAQMVISDAAAYGGAAGLSSESHSCVDDARQLLAVALH